MSTRGRNKQQRTEQERARTYQARQEHNADRVRRRSRDNAIAGIGGGVLLAVILAAQVAFFTVGPGRPAPEHARTPTPQVTTPAATPASSPAPTP